jgi:hypothetical protein
MEACRALGCKSHGSTLREGIEREGAGGWNKLTSPAVRQLFLSQRASVRGVGVKGLSGDPKRLWALPSTGGSHDWDVV